MHVLIGVSIRACLLEVLIRLGLGSCIHRGSFVHVHGHLTILCQTIKTNMCCLKMRSQGMTSAHQAIRGREGHAKVEHGLIKPFYSRIQTKAPSLARVVLRGQHLAHRIGRNRKWAYQTILSTSLSVRPNGPIYGHNTALSPGVGLPGQEHSANQLLAAAVLLVQRRRRQLVSKPIALALTLSLSASATRPSPPRPPPQPTTADLLRRPRRSSWYHPNPQFDPPSLRPLLRLD